GTRSSPTTPPVGCCTFFTLESTTIEPDAMSAPEIGMVAAQPPTPTDSATNTVIPARMLRRIERRLGEDLVGTLGSPGLRDYLKRAPRRLAMQDLGDHLVLRTERHGTALLHGQEEVDTRDGGRPMRDHNHDATAGADTEDGVGQRRIAFCVQVGIGLVQHH